MATFEQDPLDAALPLSDVKFYLGKITGAGNIGTKDDQGNPLSYFNTQDIGVLQSSVVLQDLNAEAFVAPPVDPNQAWINYLNQLSDTTSLVIFGPIFQNLSWTSGLPDNRKTEKNFLEELLSYKGTFVDISAIGGPTSFPFGDLYINAIKGIMAVANPSLINLMPTPNDMWDTLEFIFNDASAYNTLESPRYSRTSKFPRLGAATLYDNINQLLGGSYSKQFDIIYNKNYGDFNQVLFDFIEVKNTVDLIVGPAFADGASTVLGPLIENTPYDNVISGIIGNYQLTNTLNLTGISGYPTGYEDGKYLRSTTTGLEYVDITDPVLAFTGLSDTPSTITPNEYLRGTADGQNLIFSGVSFLEDVTDRPTVPQSGYLQRTPAGQLVWAAGTTSGDITYNFTGSDFFTGLQDTPANYDQFKFLRSALNSIEYVNINEGIVSFTGLDGTQNDFSAGKYLISSATGIEYTDIPAPVLTFTGLTDTPSSFTNASGQYLRINSAENAVEFIDISGQINSHEIAWDTYLRFGDLPVASNHAGMFTYVMIDSLSGAYVSNGTDWVKIDSDSEEGSSSFTGLSDTPNSYDSGKYLISSATGIEYVDVVAPVVAFTGLTDTPSSYAGQSGRYLMVADAETGIEFKDPTFYTGAFVGFGGAIVFKGLDTYAPAVGWNDRKLTNLVGISGIKETYLDNEQIVLPKGKYLISAEGGVNCDSSAGANPAGKTKIGIEFTSGDYIGQTFDSFSNRGQTAGNYGQIRGSIQVAIESQNPIKFKVKSYLPTVTTVAEYSFNAAQTDVSILDLGASKDFLSFTGLLDVPNTFDGASGKYLRVSDDQTELEYVDIPDAGITGAFNIGAGSGVVSGVVDQDAYFKSLVGGTNVTLSSDDSTITINAAGGGGGDSSGCCNTIKIRKNDADVPTSEMAREVISNLYFGYSRAGGYPYSYYYANLDNITDGDSNTYWQPREGHNTFSSQWGHNVQAYINFNTDIYINSIEWEGDPWYGKVQKIQSSSGTLWQKSSNNQYGVTPFTTDDINQSSTSALVGKAYQIKQGWSTITTDPNAVPSYDFSNLPAGGKLNQIYWTNPYSQTNNNAGMPFVSLVGNGRQGRYPTIKNIKLAYALTDPSVPNYIVQRPFAGGISASTNATIYLQRGQSYTFEVESAGNPFYIKTANVGGTSDLFSAGITNNGVGDGDLTFQVPYDAPETLYYVSSNVPTLSGMIKILAADGGSFSSSGVTDISNVGAGSGVASGVVDNTGYFKSLIGGTNLEILGDENSLTLNVTGISAGGGGGSSSACSGGIGFNPFVTGASNFYTLIPDEILLENPSSSAPAIAYSFSAITSTSVQYSRVDVTSNGNTLILDNDSIGTFNSKSVASHGPALSLSGYIASGRAVYLGGGSGSSSSTTGITGASNIGLGSGILSGISDNDLVFRTIEGGSNVSIVESNSGWRINASTTSVTVTGGSVSGGIGSNPFMTGMSNLYTLIPDSLALSYYGDGIGNPPTAATQFQFSFADINHIWYVVEYGVIETSLAVQFLNDSEGSFSSYVGTDAAAYGPGQSISGYIASGRGVYLGGGSGSSSSTTGITGASNLGAGSAIVSGISSNDLKVKSLVGGTNVTLSSDDSTITINAAGGGGGSTTSGECSRAIIHLQSDIEEDFTTGIYDKSIQNNTVTINGVTNSTTQVHRGNSSIYFDGSNSNYLLIPTDYPIYESTNATIESWVYWDPAVGGGSNDDMIIGRATSNPLSDGDYIINLSEDDDTVAIAFGGNKGYSFDIPSIGLPSGEWFHFAFCNNGGAKTLYINGSGNSFPSNSAGGNWGTAGNVYIGHHQAGGNRYSFRGYFQDFRVTRGECVYTGDFTPSTALLPISCGGSSSSSSSTTGITGASNIGSGSGVFSGISDNDLVFRTIEAGPNVSITESSSGLKISASTTSVTVTGGSVSGGLGSNPYVTGQSNFYSSLPDQIALTNVAGTVAAAFSLYYVTPASIYYHSPFIETQPFIIFDNNASATFDSYLNTSSTVFGAGQSISGYIAEGRGVYLGGGGSGSSTGITGATNIGSGSGVFSGISDNDLVFRTIEAGPNVSITESSSGLKITASTTNITVTGGTVSGGAGSNPFVTGASNFYTKLPDSLIFTHGGPGPIVFDLNYIDPNYIYYIDHTMSTERRFRVNNNLEGSGPTWQGGAGFNPTDTLSGLIASGRGVYLGGGSGSSSSTTGITGASNIGEGSGILSGIADNDLVFRTIKAGPNVTISESSSGLLIGANTTNVTVTGGNVSGGIGSNAFVSGASNFYKFLPDGLVHIADNRVYNLVFEFIDTGSSYTATAVRYKDAQSAGTNDRVLSFRNDSDGSNAATSLGGDSSFNAAGPNFSTLSGYVASGRAVYLGGGGSGSSSSTTGITGATNLGAGSGLISGITDNDLQVKSLVGGTNLQITGDGESLYLNVTGVSGSTVSGITGASNIGAGSGVFSGISDNELVFRTIEAGPNVSITESFSGLKISASTTNVTVTGGTVSGGLGSNPYVTGQSNFYSSLPDQIVLTNASDNNSPSAFSLYYVSSTLIYYSRPHPVTSPFTIIFDNNASATFDSYLNTSAATFGAGQSISGYVASGRGVYLGGGSGSSNSTTGLTGASNIGAGSAIVSGISSNDLKVKSLVGGTNVTLSSDDSTITIDAAGGGGEGSGEANVLAWGVFSGTEPGSNPQALTVQGGYNISGIERVLEGRYYVSFLEPLDSSFYAVGISVNPEDFNAAYGGVGFDVLKNNGLEPTTSGFTINVRRGDGTTFYQNSNRISFNVVGSGVGGGGGGSSASTTTKQGTYVGDGEGTGIYIPLDFIPVQVYLQSADGPYYGNTMLLLSNSGEESVYNWQHQDAANHTSYSNVDDVGTISGKGFIGMGPGNDSNFNVIGKSYHYSAIK